MPRPSSFLMLAVAITFAYLSLCAQPKVPYIEKNRCPFECCQFGKWISRVPLKVYAIEGDTTKVAFHISPGDTIFAETGNVYFERVGTVLVTKSIYDFSPGDTLIATQCAGEEDYEVWHKGKPFYVDVFWKTLYSPEEDEYEFAEKQDTAKFSGVMLSRPLMVWWVRIRNIDGQSGWLRLVNKTLYCFYLDERIDGMDGCS